MKLKIIIIEAEGESQETMAHLHGALGMVHPEVQLAPPQPQVEEEGKSAPVSLPKPKPAPAPVRKVVARTSTGGASLGNYQWEKERLTIVRQT